MRSSRARSRACSVTPGIVAGKVRHRLIGETFPVAAARDGAGLSSSVWIRCKLKLSVLHSRRLESPVHVPPEHRSFGVTILVTFRNLNHRLSLKPVRKVHKHSDATG